MPNRSNPTFRKMLESHVLSPWKIGFLPNASLTCGGRAGGRPGPDARRQVQQVVRPNQPLLENQLRQYRNQMMRIAGIEHPMQKRAYRFLGRGIPDMTIPNSSEITTPPKVGTHIKENATPLINAPGWDRYIIAMP